MSSVKNKLVSRRAKRIYLWFFAVVFTAAVALRVEAAVFASRIVSMVTALSTLRLGETSKAETLRRIPSLQSSDAGPYGAPHCNADECFGGGVGNGLPGRLLWRTGNAALSDVLRLWFSCRRSLCLRQLHVWKSFIFRLSFNGVGAGRASINAPSSSGWETWRRRDWAELSKDDQCP